MNESAVQQHIRLRAAQLGLDLWRNNVGACVDNTGRMVRYGLVNESAQINKEIKSSDLIGITPINCYIEGIGWTKAGIFTAIESKKTDWVFNPNDERAVAQMRFHNIVRKNGGFAGFATSPDDIQRIITK